MVMSDEEIIVSFKQAKNQKHQVNVLADLNGTNTVEMRQHLVKLGLLAPPAAPSPKSVPVIDELRAMELFKAGETDLNIAEMLGVSIHTIKGWRKRNGFMRPRGGSRPKKQLQAAPAAEPQPDAAVPAASRSPACLKFYLVLPPSTPRPGSTVRMKRRPRSMSRPSTARTDVWRLRSIS